MNTKLPSIVIVGRPNVGKSTLFNRLTGTRRSIVTNEPGITRDRIYGTAEWEGRPFEVVDTGGIVPEDKAGIPGEILRQAGVAIQNATRVVQVVDGREGPVPLDQELARTFAARRQAAGDRGQQSRHGEAGRSRGAILRTRRRSVSRFPPNTAPDSMGCSTRSLRTFLAANPSKRSPTSASRSSAGPMWANRRC